MSDTQPKPFVFVLMPFIKPFDDIYQLGIKAACHEAGAYSERVDEQQYDGSILERVYNQISKADLLIADMTGKNANVFYEVGYAHALGKRVILLTQRSEDIPFDLKHYEHIVYEGSITGLKEKLLAKVKWAVENPQGKSQLFEPNLEFIVEGKTLVENPEITMPTANNMSLNFPVVMHNSPRKQIRELRFKIGIVLPKSKMEVFISDSPAQGGDEAPSFTLDADKMLFLSDEWYHLIPGERKSIFIYLENRYGDTPIPLQCEMHALTESGPLIYPFRLRFPDRR